jgi:DNA replication ATP-dependent helicase Dna2
VSDVFQILSCLDEVMEEERLVKLRDVWMDVPVMIGDRIHIIMSHGIDETTSFIVDDKHNYLIHLPYYLVSGTVVADSFQCMRRTVLNETFRNPHERTSDMVYGSLLHEAFGRALRYRNFSETYLKVCMSTLVLEHLEDIYSIQESEEEAQRKLWAIIPQFQAWCAKFFDGHTFSDIENDGRCPTPKISLRLADVLDIEENIWSPAFGLKGKIDVSAQIEQSQLNGDIISALMPLEIKTGKPTKSASHRAQVALYTLMMSDRYGRLFVL